MTHPITKIHNVETDEVIEREMTDEEFAVYSAIQEEIQSEELAKSETEIKKQEVLVKLGLTADEVTALLA
jgi:tRNA threonylcarbamoyladenosine modification (KEOPS) complex  Pcc1 subunit